MFLLSRISRLMSFVVLTMLGLFIQAADMSYVAPSIIIDEVETVEDITSCMPDEGLYDVRISFAEHILPAMRTKLLTEAFTHERALRIEKLNLSNNSLTESPLLTGLAHLSKLDLDHNNLMHPPVLTGLVRLRALYLHDNRLVEPPVLTGLGCLEYLDLSYNQLEQPPVLTGVQRLEHLKLSYNRCSLPPVLTGMVHLRCLDLSNCQLTDPPVLSGLVSLKSLYMSRNQLSRPPVLTGLINLMTLDLDHNHLIEPPVLVGLQNLQCLTIAHNQLDTPPVLAGLVELGSLNLSYNQLVRPPVLLGLINLRDANFERNRLVQPPVLRGLINLSRLDLDHNWLVQPPVLAGLQNLSILNLSHNQLAEPPVLTGLVNLISLTLDHNYFNGLLRQLFSQRPVVIPLTLIERLDLAHLGAPHVIEQLEDEIESTRLVDIATPGVDTVPFFLTHDTITRLPIPKANPLTRAAILHTMNVVESWRYWRGRGMSAHDYDAKLQDAEPVRIEEDIYTVTPEHARLFMRDRDIPDDSITAILDGFESNEVNVTALLTKMAATQAWPSSTFSSPGFSDVSEDVLNELCPIS